LTKRYNTAQRMMHDVFTEEKRKKYYNSETNPAQRRLEKKNGNPKQS